MVVKVVLIKEYLKKQPSHPRIFFNHSQGERIKQTLMQASLSGDADSRIAGMLLTAMGETTPESSTTVNVIIQGDSDAYSV